MYETCCVTRQQSREIGDARRTVVRGAEADPQQLERGQLRGDERSDVVLREAARDDRAAIVAHAEPAGPRFTVTAHVLDAFKTKLPLDLVGWAERHACGGGAVWRFVLAPADNSLRPQLEALAAEAACDPPPPPPAPSKPAPDAIPPARQ